MPPTDLRAEATYHIRTQLAEGFSAPPDIAESVVKLLSDDYDHSILQSAVDELMPILTAERKQDIASWPAVTDCDRLDAAFEALNEKGIMARHHWWCCPSCGAAAMPDEFSRLGGSWQGKPIIGYICYCQQTTESAALGHGIHFSYGSMIPAADEKQYEHDSVEIARIAVRIIESHGLRVKWNGKYSQRPHITLNWQRRTKPPRFCEA